MIKTNKEKLFFQAARLILKDACPMNRDWYLCQEEEDGEIEPRCNQDVSSVGKDIYGRL